MSYTREEIAQRRTRFALHIAVAVWAVLVAVILVGAYTQDYEEYEAEQAEEPVVVEVVR